MKVQLIYFKSTGKYHTDAEYETEKEYLYEIWEEAKEMFKHNKRPGLIDGHSGYHVCVNVRGHIHEHPHLMLNAA